MRVPHFEESVRIVKFFLRVFSVKGIPDAVSVPVLLVASQY